MRMRLFAAILLSALFARPVVVAKTSDPATVPTPLIKAVYLYNFARFTEWPSTAAKGPLTLCVLGDAEVANSLDGLVGNRTINGRDVSVAGLATNRIVRSCHLLYVAGDDLPRAANALYAVWGMSVFTVGDGEAFVRAGGVAALFSEDGRTKFAINPDAISRAGLRPSSKMLGLARLVREETR